MEAPFSVEGIKDAVWSRDGSKSPSPYDYNFVFIKKCWNILKEDIINFVKGFHSKAVSSKVITSSFPTLIPKIPHPINLEYYRPICLVGCIYRIVAKLLVARLKNVLCGLIS